MLVTEASNLDVSENRFEPPAVVNDKNAISNTCVALRLMSFRNAKASCFVLFSFSRFKCLGTWFAMDGYDTSSTLSSSESNE